MPTRYCIVVSDARSRPAPFPSGCRGNCHHPGKPRLAVLRLDPLDEITQHRLVRGVSSRRLVGRRAEPSGVTIKAITTLDTIRSFVPGVAEAAACRAPGGHVGIYAGSDRQAGFEVRTEQTLSSATCRKLNSSILCRPASLSRHVRSSLCARAESPRQQVTDRTWLILIAVAVQPLTPRVR